MLVVLLDFASVIPLFPAIRDAKTTVCHEHVSLIGESEYQVVVDREQRQLQAVENAKFVENAS